MATNDSQPSTRFPSATMLLIWGSFFVVGLIILAPVLNGHFFADDYEFVLANPREQMLERSKNSARTGSIARSSFFSSHSPRRF